MKNLSIIALILFTFSFQSFAQSLQKDEPSSENRILALQKEISLLDDDHCEVPCGIYGDSLRIALLYEHAATIEKGMKQIVDLSKADQPNYNQIVRWVMNKETHATEIQHIVSQYFLHQRVKMPADNADKKTASKYNTQLASLHSVLVYAMKTKQSTDTGNVEKLRKSIHDFEHAYFGDHKH